MPKLTIDGKTVEVPAGRRLVWAIKDGGVNIGHRCGGYAKCTTCRVEFEAGEPSSITAAEHERLSDRDLLGQVRLSCQLNCDQDMSVKSVMTLENQVAWEDTGPEPEQTITPEPEWQSLD